MSAIVECIEGLQPRLEKHRNTDLKETPTRTIFIDPLLFALGWDVRNWDDVQLEYPTIDGKSVDYAAKINDQVVLLIEAKSLDDPLTDVKAITQIVGYAANDGIEWCILTNGVKYKVYCTREKGTAPEKLLFEISLDAAVNNGMTNEGVAECLLRFSKEAIANGVLDKLGEDTFTKNKIRKALGKMFQNPPKSLVRELRKAIGDDSIKPSQVQRIIGELWNEKNNLQISNTPISGEISKHATSDQLPGPSRKFQKGKKTPNNTYRLPILDALLQLGGRASANEVLKIVEEKVGPILNEFDLQRLPSGTDVRWRNAAQWVRLSLVKEGLLKSNSPHGIWELSEKGFEEVEKAK